MYLAQHCNETRSTGTHFVLLSHVWHNGCFYVTFLWSWWSNSSFGGGFGKDSIMGTRYSHRWRADSHLCLALTNINACESGERRCLSCSRKASPQRVQWFPPSSWSPGEFVDMFVIRSELVFHVLGLPSRHEVRWSCLACSTNLVHLSTNAQPEVEYTILTLVPFVVISSVHTHQRCLQLARKCIRESGQNDFTERFHVPAIQPWPVWILGQETQRSRSEAPLVTLISNRCRARPNDEASNTDGERDEDLHTGLSQR